MSQQQDTTADTKRKKESTPKVMVCAYEFADPRVHILLAFNPIAYVAYSIVRCCSRAEATLKLPYSQAIATLRLLLSMASDVADQVIAKCIEVGLLVSDGECVWCPSILEDVELFDKRRQYLSEAGKRGAKARYGQASGVAMRSHGHKGKVRIGKDKINIDDHSTSNDHSTSTNLKTRSNLEVPPSLDTPEVSASIAEWLAYRVERRQPFTTRSLNQLYKKYDGRPSDLIRDINYTILKGWQGIQPESANGAGQSSFEREMKILMEA